MYRSIIYFFIVVLSLQISNPLIAQADALEEYQSARNTYLFAVVCRAAYGDRTAQIATTALVKSGWKMRHYFKTGDVDEARFFLAENENYKGLDDMYLLAVSGTENAKDMKVNFDYGKVYFAGNTAEEIQANSQIKPIPPDGAAMHQGFLKYVNTIVATQDGDKRLVDSLLEDPSKKIYMVGHSLGGAVVTAAAAYLINIGVKPEQIQVVTFGAPAVGNVFFAEQFGSKMNLLRIVNHGDPIPSVLKDMVGGYKQFGQNVVWKLPERNKRFPHEMVVYLDEAIKNYYIKVGAARDAGVLPTANQKAITEKQKFYIAPVINGLPAELSDDFPYMREALLDQYRNYLPGYDVDGDDSSLVEDLSVSFERATRDGCKWVLSTKIQGYKSKNEEDVYYLTLVQTIYQVSDGRVVTMFSFGTNTKNLTPLEAVISDAMQVSEAIVEWEQTAALKK